MKNRCYFFIVLAVLTVFTACKKEKDEQSYGFSFDINNRHYSIDSAMATIDTGNAFASTTGVYFPTMIIHMGKGRWYGQADSINLLKGDVVTVNFSCFNYSLSPDSIAGVYGNSDICLCGKSFHPALNIYSLDSTVKGQYTYRGGSSTLIVKEVNKIYLAGTFSTTLVRWYNNKEDTVNLTNGSFKVPFY